MSETDALLEHAKRYFFEGMAGRTRQPDYPGGYLWRAARAVKDAKALGATVTGADILPTPGRVDAAHWPVWCAVADAVCADVPITAIQ